MFTRKKIPDEEENKDREGGRDKKLGTIIRGDVASKQDCAIIIRKKRESSRKKRSEKKKTGGL